MRRQNLVDITYKHGGSRLFFVDSAEEGGATAVIERQPMSEFSSSDDIIGIKRIANHIETKLD